MAIPKINAGHQIMKPLRSIMSKGKATMSEGRFVNTMRAHNEKTHELSGKMAKVIAIRQAVGVKTGVPKKKAKIFFKEMGDEGLVNKSLAVSTERVYQKYEKAAEALIKSSAPAAHNDDREVEDKADERVQKEKQKIRDGIEASKKAKHDAEILDTTHFGETDAKGAVTSINRLMGTKPVAQNDDVEVGSVPPPPMQLD